MSLFGDKRHITQEVPVSIIPSKIEIDFTEEKISPSAGSVFLSAMAEKMGLREELSSNIKLKKRARGSTDAEMLLSLIYSLAQGDGAILDVDRLGHDRTRCELLGLQRVPNHRRLGEYLHVECSMLSEHSTVRDRLRRYFLLLYR